MYGGAQYSTLTPNYYTPPSPYSTATGDISIHLDARTANQLGELNMRVNPGVKQVEIQGTFPQSLDSIPVQHFDEMHRLAKLTGVKPSFHGPVVEASGIGEGGFTEENRFGAEKHMESSMEKAHRLDPKGNISVTFHSSASLPDLTPHIMVGKGKDRKRIDQGLFIINEDSGQITSIKPEKRYFPEDEKEKFTENEIPFRPLDELERKNKEMWTESLAQVNRFAEFGEDALDRAQRAYPKETMEMGKIDPALISNENDRKNFENAQRAINHGQVYLRDSYRSLKGLFNKAWAHTRNPEDKEKLKNFVELAQSSITKDFETDPDQIVKLREVVEHGLKTLSQVKQTPEMWQPLDQFVVKKSAETFANIAEKAYSKFGSSAPIVNIENAPANNALSSGEQLRNLVEKSREQLVNNLKKSKGMSVSQAKAVADKMIGATWDVGHINMLRKKGYNEKEIIEQTKAVAPFVKHVHLSDNFGMEHTELPMGMGNVPLKGMMDEIKKEGFKGAQVIEAMNWWQYFAEHGGGNAFKPTIEALDSPIYAMAEGAGWGSTNVYGAYYSGHGAVNPGVHHNTYGAGFQTLPTELGGEIPGDRGRFAGSPNQ